MAVDEEAAAPAEAAVERSEPRPRASRAADEEQARRIAEAATMGFKRVLLPEAGSSPDMGKKTGIELVQCNTLAQALEAALDVKPSRSAIASS